VLELEREDERDHAWAPLKEQKWEIMKEIEMELALERTREL
jgi:hypothetical protein